MNPTGQSGWIGRRGHEDLAGLRDAEVCARVGRAWSTAAKYSNGAAIRRYPGSPDAVQLRYCL